MENSRNSPLLAQSHDRICSLTTRVARVLEHHLETSASTRGTYEQRFARTQRCLDDLHEANRMLRNDLSRTKLHQEQFLREFAIACANELPHQHAPTGVYAKWNTGKPKHAVTGELVEGILNCSHTDSPSRRNSN